MEQLNVKAKKWGNSFGIILPKYIVEKEKINEGTDIIINLQTRNKMTIGDVIALAKQHPLRKTKKSTSEIINEIDKELYGIKRR